MGRTHCGAAESVRRQVQHADCNSPSPLCPAEKEVTEKDLEVLVDTKLNVS